MKQPVIGVLTWREGPRFAESAYFRRLIKAGRELGAVLFLFAPRDVDRPRLRVRGFVPGREGGWKSHWFRWPDLVIDRYRYYPLPKHKAYIPFRRQNLFEYVNSRMANKWKVYQLLAQDSEAVRWLPETAAYSRERLTSMLARHTLLYVKPSNGSGGRGILRIKAHDGGYTVRGKSKRRAAAATFRTRSDLAAWVERWIAAERWGKEVFVLQQGLHLDLLPRRPIDLRVLIQKDGTGAWQVTGGGVRVGRSGSATSNLHTGGKAIPALPFLTRVFGEDRARTVWSECEELAQCTARAIERSFGRMMELGLDIGVDRDGHVWLIEVNPKPGRDIFREMGDHARFRLAVRRPVEYALYLLSQKKEPAKD